MPTAKKTPPWLQVTCHDSHMIVLLTTRSIDLLMYADDIMLMSLSEEGLRKQLRSLAPGTRLL